MQQSLQNDGVFLDAHTFLHVFSYTHNNKPKFSFLFHIPYPSPTLTREESGATHRGHIREIRLHTSHSLSPR